MRTNKILLMILLLVMCSTVASALSVGQEVWINPKLTENLNWFQKLFVGIPSLSITGTSSCEGKYYLNYAGVCKQQYNCNSACDVCYVKEVASSYCSTPTTTPPSTTTTTSPPTTTTTTSSTSCSSDGIQRCNGQKPEVCFGGSWLPNIEPATCQSGTTCILKNNYAYCGVQACEESTETLVNGNIYICQNSVQTYLTTCSGNTPTPVILNKYNIVCGCKTGTNICSYGGLTNAPYVCDANHNWVSVLGYDRSCQSNEVCTVSSDLMSVKCVAQTGRVCVEGDTQCNNDAPQVCTNGAWVNQNNPARCSDIGGQCVKGINAYCKIISLTSSCTPEGIKKCGVAGDLDATGGLNLYICQSGKWTQYAVCPKEKSICSPITSTSLQCTAQASPLTCGDKQCNNGETCSSCPADCGFCIPLESCGDTKCNANENCSTCSVDCGKCLLPPITCNNGKCDNGETCKSCPTDCGICKINPSVLSWVGLGIVVVGVVGILLTGHPLFLVTIGIGALYTIAKLFGWL